MESNQGDALLMNLERSLHYQREEGIDPKKGWRAYVFVRLNFEALRAISDGEEGGRKRIPVPRSHVDKRIGERSGPPVFQFNRDGC